MKRPPAFVATAVLLLAAPTFAQAAMHRCRDVAGQVAFTDQACPAGTVDLSPPEPPRPAPTRAAAASVPHSGLPAASAPRPPADTLSTIAGQWPRFTPGPLSMRFEREAVIVTNHTGEEAFYFLAPYPNSLAMVPASTPQNRIAPSGAVRVALSRELADVQGLVLTWWRKGDKFPDTDIHSGKDFQKLLVLRVKS